MLSLINGSTIGQVVINGSGWESFLDAELRVVQADGVCISTANVYLDNSINLFPGDDLASSDAALSIEAAAAHAQDDQNVSPAVNFDVGAHVNSFVDEHALMAEAVAIVDLLLDRQEAADELFAIKSCAVLSALDVLAPNQVSDSIASIDSTGLIFLDQETDICSATAANDAASMAEWMGGGDVLDSIVRISLRSHRYGGSRIARH